MFVITFIANSLHWNTAALILSVIFAIVVFLSLITFLISFVTSIILLPNTIKEKRNGNEELFKNDMWAWGGVAFRLVEEVACLYFVLKLYKLFY